MTDTLPDRLSSNPNSPYYDEALLQRGIGIRFNGAEKTNVDEYCVSEGWIRVTAGSAGRPEGVRGPPRGRGARPRPASSPRAPRPPRKGGAPPASGPGDGCA